MTQIDTIKRALRLLGVIAPGEDLPDAERVDGAAALQGMLGDWATQKFTMFATVEHTFDLEAGTADYTVGTGGDFNIPRPTFVDAISLISNEDPTEPVEYELEVIRTWQRWQAVSLKSLDGGWPSSAYYQKTFPLARIALDQAPDDNTLDLKLYVRDRVTGLTSTSATYTFPDGYEDAITYNLARRLAPEFGVTVPEDVVRIARETFTNIKRVNSTTPELTIDGSAYGSRNDNGTYDWRSDEVR